MTSHKSLRVNGSHENKHGCSIQTWAIFRKFHLQKKLQSQPNVDDLTDVSSGAEVVEDVAEMRPESPESEHERVEVPVVNPTGKPAVSSKRKAPQTKLHSICSKRA